MVGREHLKVDGEATAQYGKEPRSCVLAKALDITDLLGLALQLRGSITSGQVVFVYLWQGV